MGSVAIFCAYDLIVLFPILLGKEAVMGKSLNGKELGNRISQKKDGLYQIPFTLHTLFLEMEKFEKKCKKGVKMVQ